MSQSKITEFKGHYLLVLEPESRFPFQFGLRKAKLILDNADAIREFVAAHDECAAATQVPQAKVA
jgi:hypothetical protein